MRLYVNRAASTTSLGAYYLNTPPGSSSPIAPSSAPAPLSSSSSFSMHDFPARSTVAMSPTPPTRAGPVPRPRVRSESYPDSVMFSPQAPHLQIKAVYREWERDDVSDIEPKDERRLRKMDRFSMNNSFSKEESEGEEEDEGLLMNGRSDKNGNRTESSNSNGSLPGVPRHVHQHQQYHRYGGGSHGYGGGRNIANNGNNRYNTINGRASNYRAGSLSSSSSLSSFTYYNHNNFQHYTNTNNFRYFRNNNNNYSLDAPSPRAPQSNEYQNVMEIEWEAGAPDFHNLAQPADDSTGKHATAAAGAVQASGDDEVCSNSNTLFDTTRSRRGSPAKRAPSPTKQPPHTPPLQQGANGDDEDDEGDDEEDDDDDDDESQVEFIIGKMSLDYHSTSVCGKAALESIRYYENGPPPAISLQPVKTVESASAGNENTSNDNSSANIGPAAASTPKKKKKSKKKKKGDKGAARSNGRGDDKDGDGPGHRDEHGGDRNAGGDDADRLCADMKSLDVSGVPPDEPPPPRAGPGAVDTAAALVCSANCGPITVTTGTVGEDALALAGLAVPSVASSAPSSSSSLSKMSNESMVALLSYPFLTQAVQSNELAFTWY